MPGSTAGPVPRKRPRITRRSGASSSDPAAAHGVSGAAAQMSSVDLSIAIALGSTVFFALGLILTQYGLRYMGPFAGATISVPTTTLLCWLASPWLIDTSAWSWRAVGFFAAVGLFYPGVVSLITFEA